MSDRTVSLFIPCLVDQVYPEMGWAMVRVLRHLGYDVDYRPDQTCCGQPAFNAGQWEEARQVAGHCVKVFGDAATVVCPSGSCTAMIREFYPRLFEDDPSRTAAVRLGPKVREFSEFLHDQGAGDQLRASLRARVGFHNSCHGYRELGLRDEARSILERVDGLELVEAPGEPVCCGFGGLFSVKYDSIAAAMASTRLENFMKLEIELLVSNDPGCIMHMRQEAAENGFEPEILHLAELLERALNLKPAHA